MFPITPHYARKLYVNNCQASLICPTLFSMNVLCWSSVSKALFCIVLICLPFHLPAKGPFNVSYSFEGNIKIVTGKPFRNGMLFNETGTEPLRLVTLDWPPYIGDMLCNKGWVYQLTVALFNEAGLSFYIEFLPWARAVRDTELGRADVLFPEYFIESNAPSDSIAGAKRLSLVALSSPFEGGEVSLLKRKETQIAYEGFLSHLKSATFGVVRGYQNTPEFDALMDAKLLKVVEVVDDFQLVSLLINQRVDLIVSDPEVAKSAILLSDLPTKTKIEWLDTLDVITPHLAYNSLYFAVSNKTENSQIILDKINATLLKFSQTGTLEQIIKSAKAQCQSL